MAGMMGGPTAPATPYKGGGVPTTAPSSAPAKAPAAGPPMVGGGSMAIPSPIHPAAAAGATAGRGMLAPTPTGPSNPAPQGAPMGGAPHPAAAVPIRPIQGPVRPRVM